MPTGSNNPLGKIRPGFVKHDLTVLRQATPEDFETIEVRVSKSEKLIRYWVVECVCGKQFIASTTRMNCKNTKSCGCKRYRDFIRYVTDRHDPVDMVRRNCFSSMRSKAKARGLEWTIKYDSFVRITAYPCHYCGAPPSNVANPTAHHKRTCYKPEPFLYSGLDRIDSSLGYHVGNVMPSCIRCNQAKNDMTTLEFYKWLNRVHMNRLKLLNEVDAFFNWDNCAATSC